MFSLAEKWRFPMLRHSLLSLSLLALLHLPGVAHAWPSVTNTRITPDGVKISFFNLFCGIFGHCHPYGGPHNDLFIAYWDLLRREDSNGDGIPDGAFVKLGSSFADADVCIDGLGCQIIDPEVHTCDPNITNPSDPTYCAITTAVEYKIRGWWPIWNVCNVQPTLLVPDPENAPPVVGAAQTGQQAALKDLDPENATGLISAAIDDVDAQEDLTYVIESCTASHRTKDTDPVDGISPEQIECDPVELSAQTTPGPTQHQLSFVGYYAPDGTTQRIWYTFTYHVVDSDGNESLPQQIEMRTLSNHEGSQPIPVATSFRVLRERPYILELFAKGDGNDLELDFYTYRFTLDTTGTAGTATLLDDLGGFNHGGRTRYTAPSDPAIVTDSFGYRIENRANPEDYIDAIATVLILDPANSPSFPDRAARTLVIFNENYDIDTGNIAEATVDDPADYKDPAHPVNLPDGEPDGLEIARYYATARGVPPSQVCGVQLEPGVYIEASQLVPLRDQLLGCLCTNLASPPTPCDATNLAAVAATSPFTHLVWLTGLPTRLYNTGWFPGGESGEVSKPAAWPYVEAMLYNDFDPTDPDSCSASPACIVDGSPPANWNPRVRVVRDPGMFAYSPETSPQIRPIFTLGQLMALTPQRTRALIDRTLDAEAQGFVGNLVTGAAGVGVEANFETLADLNNLTNSYSDACFDYTDADPFLFSDPASTWDSSVCRVGTLTSANGNTLGAIPGEVNTAIKNADSVGALLNTVIATTQAPFDDEWDTVRRWRKDPSVTCEPLCLDYTDPTDEAACRDRSKDVYEEIDTDCVGGAAGLLGTQFRSYPSVYYGLGPSGFGHSSEGPQAEVSPALVLEGEAYQDFDFTDDHYLHFGVGIGSQVDDSLCADGTSCAAALGLHLEKVFDDACKYSPPDCDFTPPYLLPLNDAYPTLPQTVAGSRTFRIRARYRTQPPSPRHNGTVHLALTLFDASTGNGVFKVDTTVPPPSHDAMGACQNGNPGCWELLESVDLTFTDLELSAFDKLELEIRSTKDLEGFFDIDGIELVDLGSDLGDAGDDVSILPIEFGSFDPAAFDSVKSHWMHNGTWPAFWIDRLQGIGFWGTTQHGFTTFEDDNKTTGWGGLEDTLAVKFPGEGESLMVPIQRLFSGRTLAEALSGSPATGLYADPLYRPSAASLRLLQGDTSSVETFDDETKTRNTVHGGLVIDDWNRDFFDQPLLMNVLHGSDNAETTEWEISTCSDLDPHACDTTSGWTVRMSSVSNDPHGWSSGSQYERLVEWLDCQGENPATSHQCFLDPTVNQSLLIRLRVWNPGDEANAIYDHAFLNWQVLDFDRDGVDNSEDNCTVIANPSQLDADLDGYGNYCDADFDQTGVTTVSDLNVWNACFGKNVPAANPPAEPALTNDPTCAESDMDGSGVVTITDFNLYQDESGTSPGPSGLACAQDPPADGSCL